MHLHQLLRDRGLWADIVALLAGLSSVFAFAPFGIRFVAVLAPAALFLTSLNASRGRAFRRGYLFGLGQFGAGVSWVYWSIHLFGHAAPALAGVITLLFVLILAVYPGCVALVIASTAKASPGVRLIAVAPASWVTFEWLRSWLLTGFPWLLLGHSQIDTWLGAIAPIFGVLAASWLAALCAGLVAFALRSRARRAWLALTAIAGLWLGAAGLGSVTWTEPAGEKIVVSLVQGNIPQVMKWDPATLASTMELYQRLTREHWDSDLIIWPETAIPAFYREVEEEFLIPLAREARQNETDLLTGIFVFEDASERVFNSVVTVGSNIEFYHKRHLVPFGEYLPFRDRVAWLHDLLNIPMSDLSAGADQPLVRAAGNVLGVSVCYEVTYGAEVIDALPEATLLVNVSNDAWFGDSWAPHQHFEIARMRALETGRTLLRATNTGISGIIGAQGQVIARAPQFEVFALKGVVQPMRGMTPYARWGNWPVVMLVLIVIAVAAWWAMRQRSSEFDRGRSHAQSLR